MNVSTRDAADARRSLLYQLRDSARPFQINTNARKCGRVPHGGSVEIRLRVKDGSAHYHGLTRCACWHSCPVCGWQIAMHRAADVRRAAEAHRATGGAVYLVTFTLPHDLGDRLQPLYHAVADAYRRVHSGTPWLRMKEQVGYVGEVRALEVTVGANGWHPHLHALVFTSQRLSVEGVEELRSFFLRRWSGSVVRAGYREPSPERGVVIVESHLDEYLAKMGLADELAKGVGKEAEGGSRTPLRVLADFQATGDLADLALWREWNEAMHAARQLTWSRALRGRYVSEPEKTDAEIISGEPDETEVEVAIIAPNQWWALVRANRDVAWQLLDAAETRGADAVALIVEQTLGQVRIRAA